MAPTTLLAMLLAGIFGLLVGAVPGLTATMAIALLVPLTFYMEPVPAIAAMVAASAMAIFAGDLPAVLLRMPGSPASAAYTDAVHRMTLAGKVELAPGICLVTSSLGGLFGALVLTLAAPELAELALNFSSFENFWLACLGLTCAAFVAGRDSLEGLVSLLRGLLFSTVGLDPITGLTRFTFGNVDMVGGPGLVPGLVGAPPGVGADIAAWISDAVGRRRAERLRLEDGEVGAIASAGAANHASLAGACVAATVFGIPGDSITAIVIGVLFIKA